MRRFFAILLTLFFLAATGCSVQTNPERTYQNPIRFYYCDWNAAHGGSDGVLAYETVELGRGHTPEKSVLTRYFSGPQSENLTSPFPKGIRCEEATLTNGVLSIRLSEEYDALSGVWLTLTNACLVRTLLQLPEVNGVYIENASLLTQQTAGILKEENFLFEDLALQYPAQSVTIYVPNTATQNLKSVQQTVSTDQKENMALLALETLFAASDLFTDGTSCVEFTMQGGFCTTVLSEEFLDCDRDVQTATLAVRSVVATLCALDGIERVQLSVEGGQMQSISLTEPLQPQQDWYESDS